MLILLPGGHAAADMALRFVDVQDDPGPGCQRRIYVLQPVRDVLVDRALAYPKFLRRLPHRGIVVYDVIGNGNSPLFDIILQKKTPQNSFLQSMKNSEELYRLFTFMPYCIPASHTLHGSLR